MSIKDNKKERELTLRELSIDALRDRVRCWCLKYHKSERLKFLHSRKRVSALQGSFQRPNRDGKVRLRFDLEKIHNRNADTIKVTARWKRVEDKTGETGEYRKVALLLREAGSTEKANWLNALSAQIKNEVQIYRKIGEIILPVWIRHDDPKVVRLVAEKVRGSRSELADDHKTLSDLVDEANKIVAGSGWAAKIDVVKGLLAWNREGIKNWDKYRQRAQFSYQAYFVDEESFGVKVRLASCKIDLPPKGQVAQRARRLRLSGQSAEATEIESIFEKLDRLSLHGKNWWIDIGPIKTDANGSQKEVWTAIVSEVRANRDKIREVKKTPERLLKKYEAIWRRRL